MEQEKEGKKLFWIDMEMTGLDETKEKILEVAALVTDLDFNIVDEYQAVVYQPKEIMDAMDDWCTKTHGESGLTQEVEKGLPLTQVEEELMTFTAKYFGKERVILCGNSVSQDRKFIDLYMKKFADTLHYRIIDVSSFKEIFHKKYKASFNKKERHRASADIHESVAELKHYLSFVNEKTTF